MRAKHKIVLYNPQAVFYDMPLALLALGSCFDKQKYEIVIVDARIHSNPHEKVLEEVKEAICFGTTVLTGRPIEDALAITRKVKQQQAEIPTIWGGWHTSLFPTQPLEEEPSIDITVQGQGEITFQELVDCFIAGQSIKKVKGICWRNQQKDIVKNPPRPISDMNELPEVDYSLIDVEAYFKKKGQRQFDYISSIGCFYRCTFCADPYVFGRKFSAISAKKMLDAIEKHYHKYNFTSVNFQDETFFTYRDRVIEMAQGFVDRNIKIRWAATMRADQGDRLSQGDFKLLAKSGMFRVLVGVESGSQEMMDWLKKDIKMEQVLATADKCKEAGVGIQFPFIVGFPEESAIAFQSSIKFAIKLSNLSVNFKPTIFYYKPYPGTPITDDLIKGGYKMPTTMTEWSHFDYISNSGPWVTQERKIEVERLKFYIRMAKTKYPFVAPLKWIAVRRMKNNFFRFPIEQFVINRIKPAQKLS